MRGCYNIHDHTNMRMGLVPFKGSNKSGAVASPTGVVYDKYPYDVVEKEEEDGPWVVEMKGWVFVTLLVTLATTIGLIAAALIW